MCRAEAATIDQAAEPIVSAETRGAREGGDARVERNARDAPIAGTGQREEGPNKSDRDASALSTTMPSPARASTLSPGLSRTAESAGQAKSGEQAKRGEPITIGRSGIEPVTLSLTGVHRAQCKSNWNDMDIQADLEGLLLLTATQLRAFYPSDPVRPGDRWTTDASVGRSLARRLFRAVTLKPRREVDWVRWHGGPCEAEELNFAPAAIHVELARLEVRKGSVVAHLKLTGQLSIDHELRLRSRHGPNVGTRNMVLSISLALVVDVTSGRVIAVSGKQDGVTNGRYHEPLIIGDDEIFKETTTLDCRMADANQRYDRHRLESLIEQLGHADYRKREAASESLRMIAAKVRPALSDAAERTTDMEVQTRLRFILASTAHPEDAHLFRNSSVTMAKSPAGGQTAQVKLLTGDQR